MRFLFRGFMRETGEPVEGHVEAASTEAAYNVLGQNGIVTETLRDDPKSLNLSPNPSPIPRFAEALDSALDSSSLQVPFDDLTERYRGKKVWVIDRDKIRQRVAQVVDSTLAASEANFETGSMARQRVANAISGLFHDTRNIASEHSAESIAGMRVTGGPNYRTSAETALPNGILEQQIGRLTDVVQHAEGLIAAMSSALRNIESGAAPRRHLLPMAVRPASGPEQNAVLAEIFQSNLELRRLSSSTPPPGARAAG